MPAFGLRRITAAARLAALAALTIGILIATLPAAALAGEFTSTSGDIGLTVPGDHSAGDQYVETLPTIGGPRAPRKQKRAKKLPKHVQKKLDRLGGSDAGTLAQLASSTALGAPDDSSEGKQRSKDASANGKGSHDGRARNKRGRGSAPAVPSAAINAADRGEAGLEWLAIAILAITALSLGAVGYQRHRNKDSTSG